MHVLIHISRLSLHLLLPCEVSVVLESCSSSQPRCWDSSMLLLCARHKAKFSV